jgi:hypothetical protein
MLRNICEYLGLVTSKWGGLNVQMTSVFRAYINYNPQIHETKYRVR